MSPCRVPSCRSPIHVFAYSCAPPPTAAPALIHLQSLAAVASEELTCQVQKRLSVKERAIKSLLSLCSCQSPFWCFIGVNKILWFPFMHSLPQGTMPPLTRCSSAANTAEKGQRNPLLHPRRLLPPSGPGPSPPPQPMSRRRGRPPDLRMMR